MRSHNPPTNDERPRVVFFGSGPVAARSLELLQEWCNVEAVITKPQPPHHRQSFPVIEVARQHGLPLHFAASRSELDKLVAAASFNSQLAVLVDYGIIVSRTVIEAFPLGIVNSHFSLLPEWRGADPISFAILSGQPQTGVSLMLLVERMDEGPLLAYGEYDMPAGITTPQLTHDLIELSDSLLQHSLSAYLTGAIVPQDQSVTGRTVSYSRKLTKQDGWLDFQRPASELVRQVRAFIEWPKSRTQLAGREVVVTAARAQTGEAGHSPEQAAGTAFSPDGRHIAVQTADGLFMIERLKPAGKPEMSAAAFLAGHTL